MSNPLQRLTHRDSYQRVLDIVDSHTCGQPTRVILAGHGLTKLAHYADLSGLTRVVSGGRAAPDFKSIAEGAIPSKKAVQKMPLGAE